MKTFQEFLRWERTTKDTIDFKKIYVDIAGGDPIAGLALSAIMYWHLPDKTGKSKLRVFRDGYWWVARARDDWWEECRLTPKRVDRAIAILRDDEKIIQTANFKFGSKGAPTLHIRVLEENFLTAWEGQLGPPIFEEQPQQKPGEEESSEDSGISNEPQNHESEEPKTEGKVDFDEKGKRDLPSSEIAESSTSLSTKTEGAFLQKGKKDIPKRSKTLIGTESTHQVQQSQQQQGASANAAVAHSNSDELEAASSSSADSTNSDNRVLKLPQVSGAARQPSASQKRARATAQKQHEAGQTTLPAVAASAVAASTAKRQTKTAPVVEKLLAIGTGADVQVIMRYASLHPEHAELVARHFPGTKENTQEYWDEYNAKRGTEFSRANGLVQRLKNPQWEPPQLAAERKREENALAARARREREEAERSATQHKQREEYEQEVRAQHEIIERYRALPKADREAVREIAWKNAPFLRDLAFKAESKGTLRRKNGAPDSALFDGWTRDHSEYAPFAAVLRQALHDFEVAQQNNDENDDFEEYDDLPQLTDDAFVERKIGVFLVEIENGNATLETLDDRRAVYFLDGADQDETWAKIRAGVEQRVLEQAA